MTTLNGGSVGSEKNRLISSKLAKQIFVFGLIAVIFVIFDVILKGRLLTLDNIKNIVSHSIFPAFVAWGMCFIFTAGIIDLSVGANILLSANIGALLATDFHLGYFGLIAGTLLSAVILEQLMVRCTVSFGIPSWISGLGLALVYEAILSQYATIRAVKVGSSLIKIDDYAALGIMPTMLIPFVVGFVAVYFLFNKTTIGFNIRAIGGNDGVAQAMGINKKKVMLVSALIGGIFIGVAAVMQISYAGYLSSTSGLGSLSLIFKALATVLLAQSFERIISMPVGILLGSIVIMSVFNILTLMHVPSGTGQEMFLGGIVILCGVVSQFRYKGVVK